MIRKNYTFSIRLFFFFGLFSGLVLQAQYKKPKHWLSAHTGVYSFNAPALSAYNGEDAPALTGNYFNWSPSLQHSYGLGYSYHFKSLEIGLSLAYHNWFTQYYFYPDLYFRQGNPPRPINNTLTRAEINIDFLSVSLRLGNYHHYRSWSWGYNLNLMGFSLLQNNIVHFSEPQSGNNQRIETHWEENTPTFNGALELAPALRSYILRNKTLYLELQPFVRLPFNPALGEYSRYEQALQAEYLTKHQTIALHYGARLEIAWSIF